MKSKWLMLVLFLALAQTVDARFANKIKNPPPPNGEESVMWDAIIDVIIRS